LITVNTALGKAWHETPYSMSGYAEDAIPGEINEDQTINILPKPFSLQELAGKVKEVIAA